MTMHGLPDEGRALPLDWLVTPALAFSHPTDVLVHPNLTDSERKAILASWASDAHAVEGRPWLRELENGATVRLSDVLDALRALDRAHASRATVRNPAGACDASALVKPARRLWWSTAHANHESSASSRTDGGSSG
jgi:hypothetical protein